jgi:hypothetical protein
MSEQVIIDREAPPWAQRLQTDLNAALIRLDRRLMTLQQDVTVLQQDSHWTFLAQTNITSPVSEIIQALPPFSRIRITGFYQTALNNDQMYARFSTDGGATYHSTNGNYWNGYLYTDGATVATSSYMTANAIEPAVAGDSIVPTLVDWTIAHGPSYITYLSHAVAWNTAIGRLNYIDRYGMFYEDIHGTPNAIRLFAAGGANFTVANLLWEYQT